MYFWSLNFGVKQLWWWSVCFACLCAHRDMIWLATSARGHSIATPWNTYGHMAIAKLATKLYSSPLAKMLNWCMWSACLWDGTPTGNVVGQPSSGERRQKNKDYRFLPIHAHTVACVWMSTNMHWTLSIRTVLHAQHCICISRYLQLFTCIQYMKLLYRSLSVAFT